MLRELYQSKSSFVLLDCEKDSLQEILKQAQQVGLMSDDKFYLLTNLDAHTLNLEDFKVSGRQTCWSHS